MKIISNIHDGLIDAENLMVEMPIGEYLNIAEQILDNNIYQRARLRKANAMYSLLRGDLKHLCTIPTIVLALRSESKIRDIYDQVTGQLNEQVVLSFMNPTNLMILDGLQRTYTMLEVREQLVTTKSDLTNAYLSHLIRIEIYVGISRTGILYRMLTLNTGQSPMSKRHVIEILYSDFREGQLGNIRLVRQVDSESREGLDMYDLDDAVEGFNSYLNANEAPIDRTDIMEIVQRMDKLTNNDYVKDMFGDFLLTYNKFVHHIDNISNSWSYTDIDEKLRSIYGRDVARFFCKSQTISAFGATIGKLVEQGNIDSIDQVSNIIEDIRFEADVNNTFMELLASLDKIRQRAPKIGVEQRLFLRLFFTELLNPKSTSYSKMMESSKVAFEKYIQTRWKSNTIER